MASMGEGTSASVESVFFDFMTDEEVRGHSVKKITNEHMFDTMMRPVEGGIYDLALGAIDDEICKSCGQRSRQCSGHCGHIELALPVYNPLLFGVLNSLIQKTCFFCYHFRLRPNEVRAYASKLDLILKGGAFSPSDELGVEGSVAHTSVCDSTSEDLGQHEWTSLQQSQARFVVDKFMKTKKKKCDNCKAKQPSITSRIFGWFEMGSTGSSADARANVIKGIKLDESLVAVAKEQSVTDGGENASGSIELPDGENAAEKSSGTIVNAHKNKKGLVPAEYLKQREFFSGPLLPSEVKFILKHLWENEAHFCSRLFDIQRKILSISGKSKSYSMFFIEALLVPPSKFRPPCSGSVSVMEHPQSTLLSKVMGSNMYLGYALKDDTQRTKVVSRWRELQLAVNLLFDSKKALRQADKTTSGICQLLEKKEGIFRQNMMGKRVNFACRTVISPDPYLAVNEIGIPPYFALRLTYPEKVTPWNVNKLRHAIINGAEQHPGATHYVDKSTIKLPPTMKSRISISRKLPSSRGVVAHGGKSLESEFGGKVVYRHLQDGDVVLVNRQPTLHKPSMMAHVVRVLKGEKTFRLHYANCSTYNADFDGDEMNVHFPQDEISRAEAYNIVNANEQYTVPTSGEPIRGLIQDHIISAVLLTKKDTFLTQEEYHQLLYASCVSSVASRSFCAKPGKKVCMVNSDDEIKPLLPALWKPKPLWTGKQVITSILNHITRGRPPFTVKKDGRIPREYFGKNSHENKLLIRKNEFIHGVIDKAQFGKFGLVHTIQELYGSNAAGVLLSVFSRLFMGFLQMHGFTCGVDDLLIVAHSDKKRQMELERSEEIGEHVHSKFVGSKSGCLDAVKLQVNTERVIRTNGESAVVSLDRMMSGALNGLTSEVNNGLFPNGLLKPFPRNCLSLMTTTGAKGGLVNFTQISSLLGQQELEGKRVPRMVSGKTLPCFHPWDSASRAGGFIADRFLTGLRPQEYYFHCMAGREGLVDTAVKTSRSGYLQRCLIKTLECLKVCYDLTVRDSDGSVIQFCYGDDGVDVHKSSFLSQFKLLASNQNVVLENFGGQLEDKDLAKSNGYVNELPNALEEKTNDFISSLSRKKRDSLHLRKRKKFMKIMKLKYLSSLAQPGEAVGVLAAQSVGEPSTQMTLNTFHFAGRGEMNVTLGIPRLQEILMRASENILTPVMTCPLQRGRTRKDAERLAAKLNKISVADIIESMQVRHVPYVVHDQEVCTIYKLQLKLYPPELYPPYSDITLEDCHETLEVPFLRELEDSIESHIKMLSRINVIRISSDSDKLESSEETDEDETGDGSKQTEEDGDGENDDNDLEDLGIDAQKRKRQAADEMDYEDALENVMLDPEEEHYEQEHSLEFESEIDQADAEDNYTSEGEDEALDGRNQIFNAEDEAHGTSSKLDSKSKLNENTSKAAKKQKKVKAHFKSKKTDRSIFAATEGLTFEVHFKFNHEPHVLLAQIAQKAAKKVYVKSSGTIDRCSVIDYNGDANTPALQTAGINFKAFFNMQDDLDINKIVSNDIHAMLNTYGVEAARATIINEVKGVFSSYGITVNFRHLSLIADYMTSAGGYRPMSRHGMADTSTSPFCKMTFETATKFIVDAALYGEMDILESPSARISLGLPIKMGTGSFDLMQTLQI